MASLVPPPPVARLAARQHGVVSGAQLRDAGLSRAQIRHRIAAGALVALYGDTYALPGVARTLATRASAAVLAVPGSVAFGVFAAALLDLPGRWDRQPEVAVATRTHHAVAGVTIHRPTDLLERHRSSTLGIAVTTVPRTVLDLAACLDVERLERLVDDLVDRRRLGVRVLYDEFDRIARRGKPGATALRRVLVPRLAGSVVPRSELERRGHDFLDRFGFTGSVEQFRPPWSGPAVTWVDVAFVRERVVVEFDGRRWHDRDDRFEGDRIRDQLAGAHGWLTFRITWWQLRSDAAGTATRLRSTLDERTRA